MSESLFTIDWFLDGWPIRDQLFDTEYQVLVILLAVHNWWWKVLSVVQKLGTHSVLHFLLMRTLFVCFIVTEQV